MAEAESTHTESQAMTDFPTLGVKKKEMTLALISKLTLEEC